jgi:hypothetical protein
MLVFREVLLYGPETFMFKLDINLEGKKQH